MTTKSAEQVRKIADIVTYTPNPICICQYFEFRTNERAFAKNKSVLENFLPIGHKWYYRSSDKCAGVMIEDGELYGDGSTPFYHKKTAILYSAIVEYISANYNF